MDRGAWGATFYRVAVSVTTEVTKHTQHIQVPPCETLQTCLMEYGDHLCLFNFFKRYILLFIYTF